jgi:serine/threonine protein kinase
MSEFFLAIHRVGSFYISPVVEYQMRNSKPLYPRKRNRLVQLRPDEFEFSSDVRGPTAFGSVVTGKISGINVESNMIPNVIFKTKDVSKSSAEAESLQKEADIYQYLRNLQRHVIPYFYGYVDFNGFFRAIVLEDCGRPIQPHQLRAAAADIRQAVERLHDYGVVHGDLGLRNILINSNGQIRITDFGEATIIESQEAAFKFTEELARLNVLLSE